MSRKNESLPAFPAIDEDHYFEGMTKLEYVAAQVYPFYLQRAYVEYDKLTDEEKEDVWTPEFIAAKDAMIAASKLL